MRWRIASVMACVAIVSACGTQQTVTKHVHSDGCMPQPLSVFAASSLKNILNEVKAQYLAENTCTSDIVFNFGSSATLAAQIVNGAPANVFIAASAATMQTVSDADVLDAAPQVIARNVAEIMVYPKSSYASRIHSLEDLITVRSAGARVGVCVASAPCGAMADSVLAKAQPSLKRQNIADSESPSVDDLVLKIQMGELDAGIVYHSDCQFVLKNEKATCVSIPIARNATNEYLVGALDHQSHTELFVKYLNSQSFQDVAVTSYGFLAP
jgi:molybdate transport system substrate-binding protein